MFSFMIFCHVWFLHTALIHCSGNSTVIRYSVPENHGVCLQCGGPDSSDVVWTHRDREVLVTRQGSYETNADRQRYRLLSGGGLCLLRLDDSDDGKFRCNQQLVAELQVLKGRDFIVSAGRTLLLPCSGSSKPKKRWCQRREGGRWETVLTRFRNGTVKPERSRFGFSNMALQIQDLQPEDAGEYLCNGQLQARLTVLAAEPPETTSIQQTISSTATAAVMETDVVEIEKKKRPENALLMVVVVGLALMILLMAAVCVLLTSMKCRRKKKYRSAAQRPEDTELQPWKTTATPTGNAITSSSRTILSPSVLFSPTHSYVSAEREVNKNPSLPEETIHYASLGRQNWRERPGRTPPDQNCHDVIYSSVITRPAAKQKRRRLHQ
ncbi:uncharacterized protein LOC141753819 isoform X2 [Sebastes fasciatus]|uniref:uncharacterized protein LOC141753819 isoform X2 n=1 Tax=Sebastes fasciatus TaxID=394691 RepID=UPI003D9DB306